MADVYLQLLGLPPTARPLTLYLLLGIASTEKNPAIIQQAADKRLAQLQRHPELSSAYPPRNVISVTSIGDFCHRKENVIRTQSRRAQG